jgi:hypothetical protein
MTEATTQTVTKLAFEKARAERSQAFVQFFSWLAKPFSVPLGSFFQTAALTEPSR